MSVALVPVTRHNLDAVCALDAGDGGVQVAPNQKSLAQAAVHAEAWPRAIEADGVLVGFVMLYDPSLTPEPEDPEFFVWRLMIASAHQRRGNGAAALRVLIDHVRTRPGARRLMVSYVEQQPRLGSFYAGLGFAPTGDVVEGEIVMALTL